MKQLGLVVIGRNEGYLLHQCLLSTRKKAACIVYVDSGSTDNSVKIAQSLRVDVIELNKLRPFTAARARNSGFAYIAQKHPEIELVQFVDGDCEVVAGWLETAVEILENRSDIAIACGRRRERFPERSIYNRLCDLEWNTPIGETKACGGDFMVKVSAFKQVNGFNQTMIAGEEPELCLRLRQQRWKILRVDADMTLHDVQMNSFNQWWQRSLRSGHAYAEVALIHSQTSERYWLKESQSIWFWGLIFPLLLFALFHSTSGFSLLLALAYIVLAYRIFVGVKHQGLNYQDAWIYAVHCVLSKFPQMQGQLQFYLHRLIGKRQNLIEY